MPNAGEPGLLQSAHLLFTNDRSSAGNECAELLLRSRGSPEEPTEFQTDARSGPRAAASKGLSHHHNTVFVAN